VFTERFLLILHFFTFLVSSKGDAVGGSMVSVMGWLGRHSGLVLLVYIVCWQGAYICNVVWWVSG